jgi:hypothetical protein
MPRFMAPSVALASHGNTFAPTGTATGGTGIAAASSKPSRQPWLAYLGTSTRTQVPPPGELSMRRLPLVGDSTFVGERIGELPTVLADGRDGLSALGSEGGVSGDQRLVSRLPAASGPGVGQRHGVAGVPRWPRRLALLVASAYPEPKHVACCHGDTARNRSTDDAVEFPVFHYAPGCHAVAGGAPCGASTHRVYWRWRQALCDLSCVSRVSSAPTAC